MSKATIIVIDGMGVGEMPDAASYGDTGANTLGNLSRAVGGLNLPVLQSLGLGNILPVKGVPPAEAPLASWGRMLELSQGKDTITGHWEMMGIISDKPFKTFPQGFPPEIMDAFERAIGRGTLGNRAASGTQILEELGAEHISTGRPIVYTSADSVFQIAAHEDVISPDELYAMCEAALAIVRPHNVCRVIARPFVGPPFKRTYRRKDFAIEPPRDTALDLMSRKGLEVISVGKVCDMFSRRGFTQCIKSHGNDDGMQKMAEAHSSMLGGLLFCNLVDFDTLYGHRNDTQGYTGALVEFDAWLKGFLKSFGPDDHLLITADHGCDPTYPTTDHTREYVPILFYGKSHAPRALGTRQGFIDIGATLAEIFNLEDFGEGGGKSLTGLKALP